MKRGSHYIGQQVERDAQVEMPPKSVAGCYYLYVMGRYELVVPWASVQTTLQVDHW